jgi:hypothetical protein
MRQAALPARSFQWAAASSYNLVGNEQAEPGFEADALFTGERCAVGFGGLVGIGTGKADRHDLSFPYRPLSETLGVFAVGELTLPLAIGCGVGAVGIKNESPPRSVPSRTTMTPWLPPLTPSSISTVMW